jgi:hypothetical protein
LLFAVTALALAPDAPERQAAEYDVASQTLQIGQIAAYGGQYRFRLSHAGDWRFSLDQVKELDFTEGVDPYEPNGSPETATPLLARDVNAQAHRLLAADDEDWIRFEARAGELLDILICDDSMAQCGQSVGQGIDPELELYDASGGALLATPDTPASSGQGEALKAWRAPADGTYLIRVTHQPDSPFGDDATYDVRVRDTLFTVQIGVIKGRVSNACSGAPIGMAEITVEPYDETFSQGSGEYALPLSPGAYQISAKASGFAPESGQLTVLENQTTCRHFQLTPLDGCLLMVDRGQIHARFLAYHGRPASPDEVAYWSESAADSDEGELLSAFLGRSELYLERYASGDWAQSIDRFYRTAFNRPVDPEALRELLAEVDSGRITVANAAHVLWDRAGPQDQELIANKLSLAHYFAERLSSQSRFFIASRYQEAAVIVDELDAAPASLDKAKSQVDDMVGLLLSKPSACP